MLFATGPWKAVLIPFTPGRAIWPNIIQSELRIFQGVKLSEFWLIWKVLDIAFIIAYWITDYDTPWKTTIYIRFSC